MEDLMCIAAAAAAAKSLQSCLTLCDPIDGSPPGSSIPGILQTGRQALPLSNEKVQPQNGNGILRSVCCKDRI